MTHIILEQKDILAYTHNGQANFQIFELALNLKKFFILRLILNCVSECCMCRCLRKPEEGVRSGAVVAGGDEPPDKGAGN